MAKDPAFLFYPGDWLGGTMGMNLEEKGAYIHLLMFQFNYGPFTEEKAKSVLREKPSLWDDIRFKFKTNSDGLYYNERLSLEKDKRVSYTESRRQSRTKSDEDNVRIYIVRDNVRGTYKIGSSVNPVRRYNELANQKYPAIMEDDQGSRDISLIWYSDSIERKEESKLHKHFSDKNITGEWFSLTEIDLKYIYSKYKGTMYRTSQRTENEIVIENVNGIKDKKETEKDFTKPDIEGDTILFPLDTKPVRELWASWKKYRWEQYGARYKLMGEQSDLKRFEGMNFSAIEKTILTAIANNWKNLYPEKNGRSTSKPGTEREQRNAATIEYLKNHYGNKSG